LAIFITGRHPARPEEEAADLDWISPETCAGLKTDSPQRGDEIVLLPDAPILAPVTEGAIESWRRCEGYATAFPRFVVGEGQGPHVAVRLDERIPGPGYCGVFAGKVIILHRRARVGERIVACPPLDRVLAHELGHVLGLRDVDHPSSCQSFMMSGIVESLPLPRRAASAECGAVSRKWVTSQERDRDSVTAASQSTEAGDTMAFTPFSMSRAEPPRLFRRAREGSEEAVNELFDRYGERLHALVRLRLGARLRRHLESRDIVQNTMMKAFQALDRFEGDESTPLMAWLGRIAENEIRDQADFYEREKRRSELETPLDGKLGALHAEVTSAVSRLYVKEQMERVERAFESLEPAHRDVIVLRNLEELSFGEIGERLQRTAEASRKLYSRAMASLALVMSASDDKQ
jgi:RNA polymerase sigma-70 factor (ECF subfamily)